MQRVQLTQKANKVGHKRKEVVDTVSTGEQLTKLIVAGLTCGLCLLILSTM